MRGEVRRRTQRTDRQEVPASAVRRWGLGARLRLLVLASTLAAVAVQVERTRAASPSCAISTSTGIDFGRYSVRDPAPLDSVGTVVYECDSPAQRPIQIDLSRGRSSTFIPRFMSGPSTGFEYNVFLDVARTTVWGDGTAGTSVFRARASQQPVSVPVYGRIEAQQDVRAGAYRDQLLVTILF
jgi:spore coat protein U-like protein